VSVLVHANAESLAQAAAAWLTDRAIASEGRFSVCLAGGTTPCRLYELLASAERERFPWSRVHWFWGDERFVPHDHADSNYRMARETMLANAPVPVENIHPVLTLGTPEASALAYERTLQKFYGAAELDPQRPLFDVVLLGLGEDGHIASLFPGTSVLNERKHWVAAVVGAKPESRITLTYLALESTRATLFLVAGAGKRDILGRVWRGEDLPATRHHPHGELLWLIDCAADPRP
jgi:6-phosphogluconolactonase